MKCFTNLFISGIVIISFTGLRADETENSQSTEAKLAKLIKLGPGVHAIKKDKNKRIISCVVVGQARISTALGKGKGLEVARSKANLDASAQFVKWLKEEISVQETGEDETVILMEGSEGEVGDALTESGKSIEKTSKKMESVSKGLARGLQLLHKEVDGDEKTYSVVKGWKADTSEGTKKISISQSKDSPEDSSSGEGKAKSKAKQDKQIESESATSEDADEFLE